ncbi:glycine cleavage system aminomethyltransferase GcvT [Altererythrobacter salegens]|uniref:aminomethyltransferase n=1 Tax=Croceibacterium salegens TaxID=1737568 RepID=A0A6I4T010_9SPHN|nr:glycine cleavage system aminomethyltransferase GcvT [Croceibacterium salegens]MXO60617.1 glycine cleavage system aminomethyltransferase GcvT [Croceibacterium salegens]
MSEDETPQPLEKLPLDAWHRANGARMVGFAGYEMPIQYEGILAEHEWTRTHAGLFDVSHMGQLMVTGTGANEALETLLPTAVSALKPGKVRYSLLLDENGGILDDLMITNFTGEDGEPAYYLVVNGATKWDDIGHLREHLPDEIGLNHMEDRALLALQGPDAAATLERVMRGITEDFGFMEARRWEFGELDLIVTRSGYTGEDGFEISVAADQAEQLAGRLLAELEIKPVGLGARDSLRLEAGLPLYGHDLSEETDPVSAGLEFAISKARRKDGGFPGAERILKLIDEGAPPRRVGLALEGRMAAREGAEVYSADTKVGTVTSGGFAPTLGHPIAMAYVDAAHSSEGTNLELEVRGKRLPATVVPMPFVPHRYFRKGAA